MCGRYTITVSFEELLQRYYIDDTTVPFHRPRYNVAPMQMVPAVINDGRQNRIGQLRWGLVSSWAKDESMAGKMINARAETLLEKASFKKLINRKRCIIPIDSFYEWKKVNGKKQPMRIMLKDESIFSLAGLYDTWVNPTNGEKVSTFTIITTNPNQLVADVHDRMPVILSRENEGSWLDRENANIGELLDLLKPYPAEEMTAYPVSTMVGNVKNDVPECIESFLQE